MQRKAGGSNGMGRNEAVERNQGEGVPRDRTLYLKIFFFF